MSASMPDDHGALVTSVSRGTFARVGSYRHDPDRSHRDPDEEVFVRPTMIFTTIGTWSIDSDVGRAHVDPSVVVLGAAGRSYRASHGERLPSDRAVFVEFSPQHGGSALEDALNELLGRVFVRQATPRTRELSRLQAALLASSDDAVSSLRADVLSMELLLEASGSRWDATAAAGRATRSDVRSRVLRAREYLDDHVSDRIDLRTLAAEVSLSPFHLARSFRREVGESPHRYLVNSRLDLAAELLVGTSLTVTQVCDRVGFGSPGHFAQSFRRRFGVAPSVYRTLMR
jgi:AraC-like DNA-binding protein